MILLGRPDSERETTFSFRILALLAVVLVSSVDRVGGAEFTGSWESDFRFDGEAYAVEAEGELSVSLVGAATEVEGEIEFDHEGWTKLEVEASVETAAVECSATTAFEPTKRRFKKLAADLSFEFRGTKFDVGLDLYRDHAWADLRAQHEWSGVEVDIKTRLGATEAFRLDFYRADVEVSYESCGVPVDVAGRFSAKKGFEWIDVQAVLPLPHDLAWLAVEVEVRLTQSGKETSLEPSLDTVAAWEGLTASLELFGEAISSGVLCLEGLRVVGVAFEGAYGDAWIESRTSFDPRWNKKIAGDKEYAWAAGLGYETDAPCDREVSVEAWLYAAEATGAFAWDRAVLTLAVRPGESWELTFTSVFVPGSIAGGILGIYVDW